MKQLILSLFIFSTFLYPSEKIVVRHNNTSINDDGEYFDDKFPNQLDTQISRDIDYFNVNLVGEWGITNESAGAEMYTGYNDTLFFNLGDILFIVDFKYSEYLPCASSNLIAFPDS